MQDEFSQALIKGLQAQVHSLLNEVSVLRLKDSRIISLEGKIETVVEYTKQLQEQNKRLISMLTQTQGREKGDENKLKSTILKLQYQIIQKNGLLEDLQQKLMRNAVSPARKRRQQAQKDQLQAQLIDKQRFLKQIGSQNSRLRLEIQSLSEKLQKMRQAEKQQQRQVMQLKSKNSRAISESNAIQKCRLKVSSLQTQLTDKQVINAQLASQNQRLARACQMLVKENTHLNSSMQNIQKQLSLEAQRHSLQIQTVTAGSKHSQTEVLKLKGKIKAMQSQQEKLQSQNSRLKALQQSFQSTKKDKQKLEQQLDQLGHQSQFNKKRLNKCQQDLAFLQRELLQTKQELHNKVKRIYDMELANKQLLMACQQYKYYQEVNSKQIRNTAQLSAQLQAQIESLNEANSSLKTALQKIQSQASERTQILVQQLQDLKTSHSTRQKIMKSQSSKLRQAMLEQEKELNLLRVRIKLLSDQIEERGVLQPNKMLKRVD